MQYSEHDYTKTVFTDGTYTIRIATYFGLQQGILHNTTPTQQFYTDNPLPSIYPFPTPVYCWVFVQILPNKVELGLEIVMTLVGHLEFAPVPDGKSTR